MTHKEILALLDGVFSHLAASDVRSLSLEAGDVSLCVEREFLTTAVQSVAAPQQAPFAGFLNESAKADNVIQIKSPIVGTYYAAPTPEAPPYVTVGSRVVKGDTLCILEAMKMMNEIEAERDGVITRALLQNGDLAEFGQVLFELSEE